MMEMEKEKLRIGQIMTVGVFLSGTLIFLGAFLYLIHHGHEIVQYKIFMPPRLEWATLSGLLENLRHSPLALIQFGLVILILLQMIRVALTTWLFFRQKDKIFTLISLFIFIALLFYTFSSKL